MLRLILIRLLLFLLPFLLYAFWLLLRRENPLTGQAWRWREVIWLSVAGFILSFVVFGFLAENAGSQLSGRGLPVESAAP